MNEPSPTPHKPRNSSLVVWKGLLILATVVLVYLLARPRGGARNQGRDFPGVGVTLSTIQLEPLTAGADRVRNDDLRGKVAVINLWGPWCPSCRAEMPHLLEMRERFAGHDDFRLLLVSYSGGEDFAEHRRLTAEFIRSLGVEQPTWHDPYDFTLTGLVKEAQLPGAIMPTTVVLDRQGVLRGLWIGFSEEDDPPALAELVEELLAAPQAPSSEEASWQEQAAQVRAGRSAGITVESALVTDADLAELEGLTGLKTLAVERSQISDQGVKSLAPLNSLESLKLRGAEIGDEGARTLAALTNLRFLNLPQARFSDEGLAALSQLPNLEMLRFGSPHVTDQGLKHIAAMPGLRFLHLIHTPVSDQGLTHLHGMKHLESFYLDGGNVTDEGLSKLLKALPGLHLHFDQHHLDNDPRGQEHAH